MNVCSEATRRYLTTSFALLFAVLSLMILSAGCGTEKKECTAPDLSTIVITPSLQSYAAGDLLYDLSVDWTVIVRYADGSPMPQACIYISGALAVPNGYAKYQFQYYSSATTPNLAIDSGFSAQTDDYGQFTFSTVLLAFTETWTDNIIVSSGTNQGSATISITE